MRTVGFKIVPVLDWKLVGGIETHFDGSKTQKKETTYDMNSITHHTITITLQDMLATPKFYWRCIVALFISMLFGLVLFLFIFVIGEIFKINTLDMRLFGTELIFIVYFLGTVIGLILYWKVLIPDWFADYKIKSFVQKNNFDNLNRWKVIKDKDWSAFTAKLK